MTDQNSEIDSGPAYASEPPSPVAMYVAIAGVLLLILGYVTGTYHLFLFDTTSSPTPSPRVKLFNVLAAVSVAIGVLLLIAGFFWRQTVHFYSENRKYKVGQTAIALATLAVTYFSWASPTELHSKSIRMLTNSMADKGAINQALLEKLTEIEQHLRQGGLQGYPVQIDFTAPTAECRHPKEQIPYDQCAIKEQLMQQLATLKKHAMAGSSDGKQHVLQEKIRHLMYVEATAKEAFLRPHQGYQEDVCEK